MLKRILVFVLMLSMLLGISVSAESNSSDDIKLIINGKTINTDVAPTIIDGRTLVPVRAVFDSFGAEVLWNPHLRQVIISTASSVMIFTIDSDHVYIDGVAFAIDVAPTIVNDRTFVPIRFISERLGYNVIWNASQRTVYISGKNTVSGTNNGSSQTDSENKPADENDFDISLDKISVTETDDTCVIRVYTSEKVVPKAMRLSSPDRIVLDFHEVNQKCDSSSKSFEDSTVSQIRWANHDGYTRVVIETTETSDYTLSYTATGCTIRVDKREILQSDDTDDDSSSTSDDKNTATDNETAASDDKQSGSSKDKTNLDTSKPLVVVDAGHGGYDSGAVGKDEDGEVVLYEKDVNFDIAKKLAKRLKSAGIEVIMTRESDISLGSTVMEDLVARAEIANEANADLFISVHNNAFTDPEATGTSVLYAGLSNNGKYGITSKELAENIQKPLVAATGLKDRGLVESPGMVVLKRTAMPAVLLECAFVTGINDQPVLCDDDKLNDIADAICEGVVKSLRKMGKIK